MFFSLCERGRSLAVYSAGRDAGRLAREASRAGAALNSSAWDCTPQGVGRYQGGGGSGWLESLGSIPTAVVSRRLPQSWYAGECYGYSAARPGCVHGGATAAANSTAGTPASRANAL